MPMFEISCITEGKRLEKILTVLDGLVHNLQVRPVRNAQVKNGQIQAVAGAGRVYDILLKHIRDNKLAEINTREITDLMFANGKSKSAYGQPLVRLIDEKILKKGPIVSLEGRPPSRVYRVIG